MSIALLFWVVFIVSLIFWGYTASAPAWPGSRYAPLLFYVLVGLLGWAVFGAAVHR